MVRISPVLDRGMMNRSLLGGFSICVYLCSSVANSVFLDRPDSYGCNADRIPGRVLSRKRSIVFAGSSSSAHTRSPGERWGKHGSV